MFIYTYFLYGAYILCRRRKHLNIPRAIITGTCPHPYVQGAHGMLTLKAFGGVPTDT